MQAKKRRRSSMKPCTWICLRSPHSSVLALCSMTFHAGCPTSPRFWEKWDSLRNTPAVYRTRVSDPHSSRAEAAPPGSRGPNLKPRTLEGALIFGPALRNKSQTPRRNLLRVAPYFWNFRWYAPMRRVRGHGMCMRVCRVRRCIKVWRQAGATLNRPGNPDLQLK